MKKIDKELWNAILKNDIDGVKKAVSGGANVDIEHVPTKDTPLFRAAQIPDPAIMLYLLDNGAKIDAECQDYCLTPLFSAVYYGNEENVKILLERGADPNHVDKEGRNSLFYCIDGEHVAIATLLIEAGCDIETKNKWGETALNISCEVGKTNFVRFLLKHGANVNTVDITENTPIFNAVTYSRTKIVEMLIEAGADLFIKRCGMTVLEYLKKVQKKGKILKLIENKLAKA